jgi:hypothetical protein
MFRRAQPGIDLSRPDPPVARASPQGLVGMICRALTYQAAEERDEGEEHDKGDGQVKDQSLHAAASFKDRTRTAAAKSATQARATRLEQDKEDDGYREYYLYDANCWKPGSQDIILTFELPYHLPGQIIAYSLPNVESSARLLRV